MSAAAPLIACAGLAKSFGGRQVLGPVDLALQPGDRLALLGPNGAGKTTLLSLLAGSAEPTAGSVQRPAPQEIGVVPQRLALYRQLSARENLELFARLARISEPEAEIADLAAVVALGDALDRPVERLSLGQAQRVNVAIGLLGDPALVLLDEPTASLDPRQRALLWRLLREITDRRGAVVFTTQNVEEVQRHADRLLVLHEGRAVHAGTVEEFAALAGSGEDDFEAAFVRFLDRVADGAPHA